MDKIEIDTQLYTKGDREEVIKRCNAVHTLTVFCPANDEGIQTMRVILERSLNQYMGDDKDVFENIPSVDMLLCFMEAVDYCKDNDINDDNLYSFMGILQSFKNLKYLNLKFTNDENTTKAYEYIRRKDTTKGTDFVQYLYKIEVLEFVLINMFTQDIVDMLNKIMIFDEIISNSYMSREFLISFDYDDYVSYINMFCSNNSDELIKMDKNIIDYLLLFPKIIASSKPTIVLLTNYSKL